MNKPFCRKQQLTQKQSQEFQVNDALNGNVIIKPSNFLIPQLLQTPKSFHINTQNIPPFEYSDAIYFFHSQSPSQDVYKQKYEFVNSDIQFNELTKTPIGAIKSSLNILFNAIKLLKNQLLFFNFKDPNFRTSYGYEDKVMMFFSESDITDFNNDISFKVPTSYVGEMCANDNGRMSFSEPTRRFLTFKKTVINCYIPDYTENIHIIYTEIQEATKPVKTATGDVFYAIFTIRR
jgi:hypothetical protein